MKIENFEMHSDIEQGDPSSTNFDCTGIIEQNLSIENDMISDPKQLRYVLTLIDTLETDFSDFNLFGKHMLTIDMQKNYTTNHNGNDLCYGELISNLFKHEASIASIQKKYEDFFPLNTLDVINTQDAIAMIVCDYAYPFVIIDGTSNIQDKINTNLNNNINSNVVDLEDMNETWKKSTLLSFGAKRKFTINNFFS